VIKLRFYWWMTSAWALFLSFLAALHSTARPLPSVLRAELRAASAGKAFAEAVADAAHARCARIEPIPPTASVVVASLADSRAERLRRRAESISRELAGASARLAGS